MVCVQVKIPSLQQRCLHSCMSCHLTPGLVEVIIFGGSRSKQDAIPKTDSIYCLGNTTVLRFGESIAMPVFEPN